MPSKKIICHDKDSKEYEIDSDQLTFRPAVYGVIIREDKLLLSKQWEGYDFPGGGIDIRETIEEALVREVKEETGLDVKMGEVVLCASSFYKTTKGEFINSILMYNFCEVTGGEITTEFLSENEKTYASAAKWVDLKDVEKIKFYNSVNSLEIIKKAKKLLEK